MGQEPFLKRLERANKAFWYQSVFRFLFNVKPIEPPIDGSKLKRVLILRRDMVGDMIITTSAIRFLSESFPNIEIDLFCSHRGKVIVKYNPRIKNVFSAWTFKEILKEIPKAQKRDYDAIIGMSYVRTTQDGLISNLISRRAVKVCIYEEISAHLYKYLFNILIDIEKRGGATQPLYMSLNQMISKLFGLKYVHDQTKQEIFFSDKEKKSAEDFVAQSQLNDYVVFNISARMNYRKWGVENNAKFLRQVASEYPDIQFVISAAPEDREEAENLQRIVNLKNIIVTPPTFDLLTLCYLISKSQTIVSPDTALIHVGATFGKPAVVLCTPLSSGIEWKPLHIDHINVYTEKSEAITTITPARVLEAFKMLRQQQAEKKINASE